MPNLTFAVSLIKKYNKVAAGNNFSVLLKNKKTYAWGTASLGQTGRNTATNQCSPLSVCGGVKTFCHISSGNAHAHSIDKYGRAWSWGNGANGKLGDNTFVNKSTPVSVAGAVKTFCEISAGGNHSLAIERNGRLWAWGQATNGRLGNNQSIPNRSTPVSVLGAVKTFCQISAGFTASLAIDYNGRAWAWGSGGNGQLGDNAATDRSTPVSVCGAVKTFCQITLGTSHAGTIDRYGRVWMWGNNANGQLGDNSITAKSTPVSISGANKTFCKINASTSGAFTLALDKNGRIWSWGLNSSGQLGDNTIISKRTPVSVFLTTNKTFCEISAGATHAMAIDKDKNVYAWGSNFNGELGLGFQQTTPISIRGTNKTFSEITANDNGIGAIDQYGRAWGWGLNTSGQIGNNSTVLQNTPVSVLGAVKTFCKITGGITHKLAIDKNGRLWAWGSNTSNSLGDKTATFRSTPISVCGAVKTFCQIAAGEGSAAIDKNGRVWTWGTAIAGVLGNNSLTQACTPISVCGAVKTFCQISYGTYNILAIDKNGRAWGWGQNSNGGLGNNSTVSALTPISVCGAVKTFCKIAAAQNANVGMAIDKNGRLWSWGLNQFGLLGINSTTAVCTPRSVCGAVKTFCQIEFNQFTAFALDKNGRAWAWGLNTSGQLGDNTLTNRSTPVSVAGAVKTFCKITGGGVGFTLAIDKTGKVWGWGVNYNGEMGLGCSQTTPIRISTI